MQLIQLTDCTAAGICIHVDRSKGGVELIKGGVELSKGGVELSKGGVEF